MPALKESGKPTLAKAVELALSAHERSKDKAGMLYVLHPLRVMMRVEGDLAKTVAVLHDVIEDTEYRRDDLRKLGYPEEVLVPLDHVTKHEKEKKNYKQFIARAAKDAVAWQVKFADLEDNMDVRRLVALADEDIERLRRYLEAWHYLNDHRPSEAIRPGGPAELERQLDVRRLSELTDGEAKRLRRDLAEWHLQQDQKQCALMRTQSLSVENLRGLEQVEEFVTESHFSQAIARCPECAQLFLHCYSEIVNANDGEDDTWDFYAPVTALESAIVRAFPAVGERLIDSRRHITFNFKREVYWTEGCEIAMTMRGRCCSSTR